MLIDGSRDWIMAAPPYIIDFHAHLMTLAGTEKLCPQEQRTAFFRYLVPFIEPVAYFTEPVHDYLLRAMTMRYRDSSSRYIYSCFAPLFLMEALRLFKTHGLPRLLQSMQSQNISHSVIYSIEPLTKTREIIELLRPYPGHFSVFGSVAASEADPVAYLEPLMRTGEIKGIKIHPMVGSYPSERLYESVKNYVSVACEYELPISIHSGHIPSSALAELSACCSVKELEPLIAAFPKGQIIVNHMGWESWKDAVELAVRYKNVLLETSWQPARVIRRAVDRIGAGRVLFGSDYPMFQQWQALREVKKALTNAEFERVASLNAAEILKLDLSKTRYGDRLLRT